MPKFHYIYLAQNLLKTRFPTSFEQKKVGNLVSDKFWEEKKSETWSPTSRTTSRPTSRANESYDKIDLMEFGLYQKVAVKQSAQDGGHTSIYWSAVCRCVHLQMQIRSSSGALSPTGHLSGPFRRRPVTVFAIIIALWVRCELLSRARMRLAFVCDIVRSLGAAMNEIQFS